MPVGIQDDAIGVKFDDGVAVADCIDLALQIGNHFMAFRDIHTEPHNLDQFAIAVAHRGICFLDPDPVPGFRDAWYFDLFAFARPQIRPAHFVIRAIKHFFGQEHRMMLSDNIILFIACQLHEAFIDVQHCAIQIKLHHSE